MIRGSSSASQSVVHSVPETHASLIRLLSTTSTASFCECVATPSKTRTTCRLSDGGQAEEWGGSVRSPTPAGPSALPTTAATGTAAAASWGATTSAGAACRLASVARGLPRRWVICAYGAESEEPAVDGLSGLRAGAGDEAGRAAGRSGLVPAFSLRLTDSPPHWCGCSAPSPLTPRRPPALALDASTSAIATSSCASAAARMASSSRLRASTAASVARARGPNKVATVAAASEDEASDDEDDDDDDNDEESAATDEDAAVDVKGEAADTVEEEANEVP